MIAPSGCASTMPEWPGETLLPRRSLPNASTIANVNAHNDQTAGRSAPYKLYRPGGEPALTTVYKD